MLLTFLGGYQELKNKKSNLFSVSIIESKSNLKRLYGIIVNENLGSKEQL
jgi:hypothetical protein